MDRVSGWYKRRTQAILLTIGLLVAIAANLSAVTIGVRLWTDSSLRAVVAAEARELAATSSADATSSATSTTTEEGGSGASGEALGPPQRAAEEFRTIDRLGFPAGWGDANRPAGRGWLAAVFGWVLTAFAVSMGAPFWFDLVGKIANLRASGPVPAAVTSTQAGSVADGVIDTQAKSVPTVDRGVVTSMPVDGRGLVVVSATSIAGKQE